MRLERWDLSEIERQRAERNAGLSGFGFNMLLVALLLVAAFCGFMIWHD